MQVRGNRRKQKAKLKQLDRTNPLKRESGFGRFFFGGSQNDGARHEFVDCLSISRSNVVWQATKSLDTEMNRTQSAKATYKENMEYIDVGATEAEAVMLVAMANEMTCYDVCDALQLAGSHNPCGQSETYFG